MSQWMPKKDSKTKVTSYNKTGFWLHALRFLRNVCTHRSLAITASSPDPAPMATIPVPNEVTSGDLMLKIPCDPASTSYSDVDLHQKVVFTPNHQAASTGYCTLPAMEFARDVSVVTANVGDGLLKILDACSDFLNKHDANTADP